MGTCEVHALTNDSHSGSLWFSLAFIITFSRYQWVISTQNTAARARSVPLLLSLSHSRAREAGDWQIYGYDCAFGDVCLPIDFLQGANATEKKQKARKNHRWTIVITCDLSLPYFGLWWYSFHYYTELKLRKKALKLRYASAIILIWWITIGLTL